MRKVNSDSGSLMYVFDSIAEVMQFGNEDAYQRVMGNDIAPNRISFVGRDFQSWAQIDEEVKKAWDEGIIQVTMSIERLKKNSIPDIKSIKREPAFNDDGDGDLDYDKLMNNEPAFRNAVRQQTGEPAEVTVITDTSTPGYIDSMDALWRGAAALALTHILEDKGYRVELWVACQVQNLFHKDSIPVCIAVQLKKCSDPLDIGTLINIVSGWYHRSVTFSIREAIGKDNGHVVLGTYGQTMPPQAAELDVLSRDPHRIYSSGTFSFSAACDQVTAECNKFKINKALPDTTNPF